MGNLTLIKKAFNISKSGKSIVVHIVVSVTISQYLPYGQKWRRTK